MLDFNKAKFSKCDYWDIDLLKGDNIDRAIVLARVSHLVFVTFNLGWNYSEKKYYFNNNISLIK